MTPTTISRRLAHSRSLRAFSVVLVAGLLLAGCVAKTPAQTSQLNTKSSTGELGQIRGVVVDGGIRPVAGALLTLHGGDRTMVTNSTSSGDFVFDGLQPGAYSLMVKHQGFLDAQTTIDVGEPGTVVPPAHIVLVADQSFRKPYIQEYKFQGVIQCGGVVNAPPPVGYVAVALCDLPNEAGGPKLTDDLFMTLQSIDGGAPQWVQCELVWESTQPLGSSFLLYMDELNRTGAGSGGKGSATSAKYTELTHVSGKSPVIGTLAEKEVDRLGRGFDLQLRVFSWYDDPTPVGFTYQQQFTVYTDIFYGFTPPAGWTFGHDGLPQVPGA